MSSMFILGTRIDNYTMGEAVARVGQLLAQGGSHYVVTPNPEILLHAYRDSTLQSILNESSLSLCDGTGAFLGAYCTGRRLKGRVTGVDFMQELCSHAVSHNQTIALIGGQKEAREKTKEVLRHRYGNIQIVGAGDEFDQEIRSDIAFVALGSPKQEQWMAQQKKCGRFRVMIAVGGAFDMLSGRLARAPKIIRRMGCEWAWRFFLEPQRAGRILAAVIIFPATFVHTLLLR